MSMILYYSSFGILIANLWYALYSSLISWRINNEPSFTNIDNKLVYTGHCWSFPATIFYTKFSWDNIQIFVIEQNEIIFVIFEMSHKLHRKY